MDKIDNHKNKTFCIPTWSCHLSGDEYISFAFHPNYNIIVVDKNDGSFEIHRYSEKLMNSCAVALMKENIIFTD